MGYQPTHNLGVLVQVTPFPPHTRTLQEIECLQYAGFFLDWMDLDKSWNYIGKGLLPTSIELLSAVNWMSNSLKI